MRLNLHVKCPLLLFGFIMYWKVFQSLVKLLGTKCLENLCGSSRVAVCRQTDGQTDMAKLTGAFMQRIVTNATKIIFKLHNNMAVRTARRG
jgi:hypothetical protein